MQEVVSLYVLCWCTCIFRRWLNNWETLKSTLSSNITRGRGRENDLNCKGAWDSNFQSTAIILPTITYYHELLSGKRISKK